MLFFSNYVMIMSEIGRIKLAHGKCHIIEDPAGIIFIGNYAFLIGNCIFSCVNKILRRTNNTNDRENANGNNQLPFPMLAARKVSVYPNRYAVGDIVTATAAARITLVLFNDLCSKNNGVDDFYHRLGDVLFATAGLWHSTEVIARSASEDTDITFTTVKYDLFLHHSDAFKLLRATGGETCLEEKLYVESYCYRIKPSVKANGVDIDTRPNDFCTLGTNGACAL